MLITPAVTKVYSPQLRIMPLVKIFAKHTLQKPIPLAVLQSKLCSIWGTKPDTTKLMLQRVDDWTDESFAEDVYGTYNIWQHDCLSWANVKTRLDNIYESTLT